MAGLDNVVRKTKRRPHGPGRKAANRGDAIVLLAPIVVDGPKHQVKISIDLRQPNTQALCQRLCPGAASSSQPVRTKTAGAIDALHNGCAFGGGR
jgi:hypothetical protein